MMTRGSTKAVVVSSPSSNQASTCGVRAGELGHAEGLSALLVLCTLGLLSASLLGGDIPRESWACRGLSLSRPW